MVFRSPNLHQMAALQIDKIQTSSQTAGDIFENYETNYKTVTIKIEENYNF